MKKFLAIVVLLVVFSLTVFAQFNFGLTTGLNFTLNKHYYDDDKEADVRKVSFPILLDVGYKLPFSFDVPYLGEASIITGGRLGYINVFGSNHKTLNVKETFWTIPILAYGKLEAGFIYTDLGIGFNIWNADIKSEEDLGGKGFDFMFMYGLGAKFNIIDKLDIFTGITSYGICFKQKDFDKDKNIINLISVLGINLGVSYSL